MGITLFRVALILGWGVILWVTIQAGRQLGFDTAGDIFFADMAHPWRAQFNIDFLLHLLLVGTWMVWSNANRMWGLFFGLLSVMGGAVFTLAYLLLRTVQVKGDMKKLLLGRHYQHSGAA